MKKRGFTLIELMVTITIMMIMTSIVLFNYNRFNENSLLNTFAYDMSLTIRQAQVYGIAVRESPLNGSGPITTDVIPGDNFSSPYGVHLSKNDAGGNPFLLFLDSNKRSGDGIYNETDVSLQTYKFQRGIKILKLCINDNNGEKCDISSIDITFVRPDPEATFTYDGKPIDRYQPIRSAVIVLSNSDETITRSVVVEATGQISVQ